MIPWNLKQFWGSKDVRPSLRAPEVPRPWPGYISSPVAILFLDLWKLAIWTIWKSWVMSVVRRPWDPWILFLYFKAWSMAKNIQTTMKRLQNGVNSEKQAELWPRIWILNPQEHRLGIGRVCSALIYVLLRGKHMMRCFLVQHYTWEMRPSATVYARVSWVIQARYVDGLKRQFYHVRNSKILGVFVTSPHLY